MSLRPLRVRAARTARLAPTLLALAAVGLAGCGGPRAPGGGRAPITGARAELRSGPSEIEATGTVEPVASADVTAQVGGLVTRIGFREGDDVREDAPLVQLDPRPFETGVAQAAAVLARDRAQARSARLEFERAETLARQELLSTGELDGKRAAADALAATVLADSADLAKARLDLAYATVRAPISGRTGRLNVHVGDLVKAADPASPIVTIHRLRPIRVRFTIPQDDLEALREEHRRDVRVLVDADPGDSSWTAGRLVFVDNEVDAATGTVLLKGEFDNRDGALWPGAFTRVRLRLREQSGATVVPSAAVGNSQNGPYCYVVLPDTSVQMRSLVVTRQWQGLAVIASGVRPGELVVTDGQVRLAPGARASIRAAAAEPRGRGAGRP